jgi:hypothetical protein
VNPTLIPIEDVQPGDRLRLPGTVGDRPVLELLEYDTLGLERCRNYVILYALGKTYAFENRARAHGIRVVEQPEAGTRSYRAGEQVEVLR